MMPNILIFKTNIQTLSNLHSIQSVFKRYPIILDWSVDIEDIDHVLRIEAIGNLRENEVINLMKGCGFHCEVLDE